MPPFLRTLCVLGSLSAVTAALHAHGSAAPMLRAANAFLAELTPAQQEKARFAFTDAERENWHFVPRARSGLPLKEMSAAQKERALALLRSGLSERGSATAEAIIALENILKELEAGALRRDPGL